MKTFTFRYNPFQPSTTKLLKKALVGKPYVRPDELVSKDLKALLQIATEPRLEIFQTIVNEKPNSVYELAEILHKSQPYILKEVRILEGLELIRLDKEVVGGRERLKPVALYSKIAFDFQFEKEIAS
ncbi:MAG: hypothetical protein ABI041_05105 [Bdellovibrionia bacterium]